MNDSVILQVDESTKGLMREIQSGISSSIEDGMRGVKEKVDSVDGNTDMILRKFKSFDGLSSTVDQLRSLAEESKKFAAIVSPLQSSVFDLKEDSKTNEQTLAQVSSDIALLVKGTVELGEKQNDLSSDMKTEIQNVLKHISERNEITKEALSKVLEKMAQADNARQDLYSKLNSSLTNIKATVEEIGKSIENKSNKLEGSIAKLSDSFEEFASKYSLNESEHVKFEDKTTSQIEALGQSLEKAQATLDIVVNLVTPFWKKWKYKQPGRVLRQMTAG